MREITLRDRYNYSKLYINPHAVYLDKYLDDSIAEIERLQAELSKVNSYVESVKSIQEDTDRLNWLNTARWDLQFSYSLEHRGNIAHLYNDSEASKEFSKESKDLDLRACIDKARKL